MERHVWTLVIQSGAISVWLITMRDNMYSNELVRTTTVSYKLIQILLESLVVTLLTYMIHITCIILQYSYATYLQINDFTMSCNCVHFIFWQPNCYPFCRCGEVFVTYQIGSKTLCLYTSFDEHLDLKLSKWFFR